MRRHPYHKLMSERLGGLILAGGRASRLHNKCFRPLGGKPLIVHVFDRVSNVTRSVVVVARTEEQRKTLQRILPGVRIVLDKLAVQGPLAGFVSGMADLRTAYVFATSCDSPFIEPMLVDTLFEFAKGNDCAVPEWRGRIDPLLAVYNRKAALRASRRSIESGETRMLDVIERLKNRMYVPRALLSKADPNLHSFQNINTKSQLAKAKLTLKRLNRPLKRMNTLHSTPHTCTDTDLESIIVLDTRERTRCP